MSLDRGPGFSMRQSEGSHKRAVKTRRSKKFRPAMCFICLEEYEWRGKEGEAISYTLATGLPHNCQGYYKGRRCTTEAMRELIDRETEPEVP